MVQDAREYAHAINNKLSGLPNDLLRQIISYLPARDMIATSILSYRWHRLWAPPTHLRISDRDRYLFRLLPFHNKDIDDITYFDLPPNLRNTLNSTFACHVSNILATVNRHGHRKLESLTVSIKDGRLLKIQAESLISCAKLWNLQHLDIRIVHCPHLSLPPAAFCILSLKRLRLHFETDQCYYNYHSWQRTEIPPSLEELSLSGFRFRNRDFVFPSSFRRLKTWKMHNCQLLHKFTVEFPNLEVFSIEDCFGPSHLTLQCPMLKRFAIKYSFLCEVEGGLVKLSVPNLESFIWIGKPAAMSIIDGSSFSPARCRIEFDDYFKAFTPGYSTNAKSILLACLNETTNLMMNEAAISVLEEIINFHIDQGLQLPIYENVQFLQLATFFHMKQNAPVSSIFHDLRCFPNIKTLQIRNATKGVYPGTPQRVGIGKLLESDNRTLDHLTEIRLSEFKETNEEMDLIKFLLEAPLLQTVIIETSKSHHTRNLFELSKKIRELPTAAPRLYFFFL